MPFFLTVSFSSRASHAIAVFALVFFFCFQSFAAPEKGVKPVRAASAEAASLSGSFLSGRFARERGDPENAARYLEQTLAADPENLGVAQQLLAIYLMDGRLAKAVEISRMLLAHPAMPLPKTPAKSPKLKAPADGIGQEDEDAIAARNQEIEARNAAMLASLTLAVDSASQGDYRQARLHLDYTPPSRGKSPSSLWLPLISGWLQAGEGSLEKPIAASSVMPRGKPAPTFVLYHLAMINDMAGFTDLAAKQYDAATSDASRTPARAVESAADFYRRNNMQAKLEGLKTRFERMLNEDWGEHSRLVQSSGQRFIPDARAGLAELFYTMASVLFSLDSPADAQLYLRLSLALRPEFPEAQLLLGGVLESQEQFSAAAAAYAAVKGEGLLAERAVLRQAFVMGRVGKFDEALEMLDKRAKSDRKNPDPLIAKGDLLRAKNYCAEAVDAYSAALEMLGNAPEPEGDAAQGRSRWPLYFARGACLEQIGEWERAEADLRRAAAGNPQHPEILNYLGYSLLVRDRNLEEARELIEQAYALRPDAPHIVDSMGWALYKTGDMRGAVPFLEQAVALTPGDPSVNDHLGDVYWRVGRRTEARYQWQRALSYSPDPELEASVRHKLTYGLADMADEAKGERETTEKSSPKSSEKPL